jgi:predicted RNA-binding Zn-ribbon protein involved in translation (DUF1610 family)
MSENKKSRFEDIEEIKALCNNPEHNPPNNICIPEGKKYCHVCPSCGKETIIRSMLVFS